MDRKINNEAIISCIIAKILAHKSFSISQITLIVPILLNDTVRNNIRDGVKISNTERYIIAIAYKELLISIINSVILLCQSKCCYIDRDQLCSMLPNIKLCNAIDVTSKSKRLSTIIQDLDSILTYIEKKKIEYYYDYFYISL